MVPPPAGFLTSPGNVYKLNLLEAKERRYRFAAPILTSQTL